MTMFNHVKDAIGDVYRAMTKSPTNQVGGEAHLLLEDDNDEPYLSGIKYNTLVPGKRFRDMDQLSGGEKAVAALALLFAIHSYRPSPFFVMDEIDANLDKDNVELVATYIRNRVNSQSNIKQPFQAIVISLNPAFYGYADGLIGVYKDADTKASEQLTFDLERFAL
jgi:structural maintenance of chromosome 1